MVFSVCGLRRLESLADVRGVRRPLSVFRVCVDMHVCVPRAGCVATEIWIGAVIGRCAAVVCSRMSFGVSHKQCCSLYQFYQIFISLICTVSSCNYFGGLCGSVQRWT